MGKPDIHSGLLMEGIALTLLLTPVVPKDFFIPKCNYRIIEKQDFKAMQNQIFFFSSVPVISWNI